MAASEPSASGEIDFSEDELRELNIEVSGRDVSDGARKRRRSMLRIPVDEVVRPEMIGEPTPNGGIVAPADALVDHAFSNGGTVEGTVPGQRTLLALSADERKSPLPSAEEGEVRNDAEILIEGEEAPLPQAEARPMAKSSGGPPPLVSASRPRSPTLETAKPAPPPLARLAIKTTSTVAGRAAEGDEEVEADMLEEVIAAGSKVERQPSKTPILLQPPPAPATNPPPSPSARPPQPPQNEELESPLRPRRKRRSKQWFEEIFDDDYLRTLPSLTSQQTTREVDFVLASLGLPVESSVLDLGCGQGRHAMELAARGMKVTGLDLSLPLLIRAADAARRLGVNVNFIHHDMRELAFESEFDAAYCMFTSFGYFDDDTNRKVAANLAQAIKPGGKLLLELVNRDYLARELPTRVWWQGDGCVVLEEVDFHYLSSRLQVQRSIVYEDGRQVEQEISIRAYSLHEIGKILHHCGFRVTEVSGDLALRGKFFGAHSRQLIVLAEKKSP